MKRKHFRKPRTEYWSIKIPKDAFSYRGDGFPAYTREYLQKRGKALFELLMNRVPAEVYNELVRQIQAKEKRLCQKSVITIHKS